MFALAAVAFVVVAGCKDACLKYVTDPRQKATLCGRCFTQSDRAAWAEGFIEANPSAVSKLLADPDWAVRWAALKAQAKNDGVVETRPLSDWVDSDAAGAACLTALHLAGSRRVTLATVLRPASAAKCWEKRTGLISHVEVDLYSADPTARREALAHLGAVFEKPPGRVVLDAMKTREPVTDHLVAALLREMAPPAGKTLLDAPKQPADTELMNRLFTVYATQIDELRPKLKDPEPMARREAIHALAEMAPLSAPELELALEDHDGVNRRAAAEGLARGESSTVVYLARRKMTPMWLALAGASGDPDCRGFLEDAIFNTSFQEDLRAAAIPALVDCEGAKSLPVLNRALSQPPAIRTSAILALGLLPRLPPAEKMVDALLDDKDPRVLAAAAHSAGALRIKVLVPKLTALLEHPEADVRREAVNALTTVEAEGIQARIAKVLQSDSDASVRLAAAVSLGLLGGTAGIPALIGASERDADEKVKLAAGESLHHLGLKKTP